MATTELKAQTLRLNLTEVLDGQGYCTFKDMKLDALKEFKTRKEEFLFYVLNFKGIPYRRDMQRRELVELFEKHKIEVINKDSKDIVKMDGIEIGYWYNQPYLEFEGGQFYATVDYSY